jgi:serine protease inhibitor
MRRAVAAVALGLTLAACGAATHSARSTPTGPRSASGGEGPAVRSTNRLALALLEQGGLGAGNAVFSPYSIASALAMVAQGAGGETAAQVERVLGGNAATLASSHRTLGAHLAGDAAQLKRADAVWVQSGLSLERQFTQTLSQDFGTAPRTTDFARQPAAATRAINAWAAAHTGNQIRNLMPPGAIEMFTRLVLADAIYVKARWRYPFDHSTTRPRSFFAASGQTVRAQFMSRQPTQLRYAANRSYRAVELPYRDSGLSMLLIMPASGTLSRFERNLYLAAIEASLRPRTLGLAMPRFHLTAHVGLNGVLAALGMPLAFSARADFSRITKTPALQIQTVEHGADLRVDEAGTVAAAATGIALRPTLAVRPAAQLVLDHPFLAFIRDRRTGTVMFAARVTDPPSNS